VGGQAYWSDVVSGGVLTSPAPNSPVQTIGTGLVNPSVATTGAQPYFVSGDGRVLRFDTTAAQAVPRGFGAPGLFSLAALDPSLFWTNGVVESLSQQLTPTEFPSTVWRRDGTGSPRIVRALGGAVWFSVSGSSAPSSIFTFAPSAPAAVPAGAPACPPLGQGATCDAAAGTIAPELDCVAETAGQPLIAHFGYTNADNAFRRLGAGPENQVDFGDGDACQPATFAPGVHHDVFAVGFVDEITWIVGQRSATASRSSPRCAPGAVSNVEVSP
jgi:hypothetical protein